MAKISIKAGSTSKLLRVFILDSSSSTGAGLTGLVFNTSSLTAYYIKEGDSSATSMTLVTMTVGTWTSLGFKEIDATNMPGLYEIGLPNAAIASGKSVVVMLKGATNMTPTLLEIELTAIDNQDSVRAGMTSLPNAAAEAAGGLFTRGTGAGQINQANNGQVDTNIIRIGGTTQTARDLGTSVLLSSGTGTGQVSLSSGLVSLDLTQAIPTSNTAQTHGDCLNAARAQGFGKWVRTGTSLVLYANDGTTALRTFTLDDATTPTSRT